MRIRNYTAPPVAPASALRLLVLVVCSFPGEGALLAAPSQLDALEKGRCYIATGLHACVLAYVAIYYLYGYGMA